MRSVVMFQAMLVVSTFFLLVLYSSLHKELVDAHKKVVYSPKARSPGPPERREVATRDNATSRHPPAVLNVSISAGFRSAFPENGAYWNRLLHSGFRRLDRGEDPLGAEAPWGLCRENNQEALETNVPDVATYPLFFRRFLQGMKCRSPPLLIDQPAKCEEARGANATFLLFAIKSRPGNFERRQAVRETWGREQLHGGRLSVRTVFLVGAASADDPDLGPLLAFEAGLYGDLLQADFHESLFNLTLKMNAFLRWTLHRCPRVSFVFSGDDDVMVNTPALLRYLESLLPPRAARLYAGQVIRTATPLRDPNSKYFIPMSFYDGPYPVYVGGGGFLVSGALLRPLYSACRAVPFFPIDDVYVGMCFAALRVSPEAHAGFHTFDIREKDRDNLCAYRSLILVHRRSPQQVKKIWRGLQSPLLTC
ncbi:N-acetyllactosaminide beta-1,3-N-acetylglucosaminyltransferase 2 [Nerophis lumbriciformis]|uniref:N-acetyllactosaminide beta-1,3-N-acetylglucosaminyltransferase 2 n=1 Tax=Nerophis lumbriciformis TaxID=546530 RepID=UPI002ADFE087|nr:N-acetyllactosaminide beta-1,3-N-acetylglucosaminyltransferase 2-like [Nerophis lumbriciformis]XP_061828338.1 N-acetyllactosaminide beta-1,3-N-acetylglucosaminyltransferase 2-like [Nerophis lumbriciformis]XP_061828339.1 N-acetyllactosaminide beta-1,3-N-acetylglucosaminyltransferase 2-like [Nerophis lumbriciformis]